MTEAGKRPLMVMVSSTARDLPEHRKEVMDACLRQSMFPRMMEHLPAGDADAIRASLDLVNEADIYLGVYAFRYGYVPAGYKISITEMEYNRAVERKIPCVIFLMHDDHPVKQADVETGPGAELLKRFKARLKSERVVNFFKSPAELRADVIDSLSRMPLSQQQRDVTTFHYVSDIPAPPEPYIAHPYVLLQTRSLVGRQEELNLLTDWVAKSSAEAYQARVFNIVAIGGMGKSALTWKWFNEIAPQELKRPSDKQWGWIWWSFYESDATFENFVTRALAYVTRRPREEVQRISPSEREEHLLAVLDREPFLLVLDGLERILLAYARVDAAHLSDEDLDEWIANRVAVARSLSERAGENFMGQHRLRKTTEPRAGAFLRKLARVGCSRILVSTRLYPADLQTATTEPLPGCYALFLKGLTDRDALDLWRNFKVKGTRDELLRLSRKFENHPLLIQALASEVANFRRAPGNFDAWCRANPEFNPFGLPLIQARSHVLKFALQGLDGPSRRVLHTIAAFRTPANYDTLLALFVGGGRTFEIVEKPTGTLPFASSSTSFKQLFNRLRGTLRLKSELEENPSTASLLSEQLLDVVLTGLEDRGLIGWDRRANRYDLHPIVRTAIWNGLDENAKRGICSSLQSHFESIPHATDWHEVSSVEDLTPAVELYNALINMGRYDDAFAVFKARLEEATHYRLAAHQLSSELLEMLFPDGLEGLPRLRSYSDQTRALICLGHNYRFSGRPKRASSFYLRAGGTSINLANTGAALCLSGALRESEAFLRRAVRASRGHERSHLARSFSLNNLGLMLGTRGETSEAEATLHAALNVDRFDLQAQCLDNAFLAQISLWRGDPAIARELADRAWNLAHHQRLERDFILAARLRGTVAVTLGDLVIADAPLHEAFTRARAVSLAEEEVPVLVALAELRRRKGDLKAARELLDDVWEPAERGPYPTFHADALNLLAQIESDAGNRNAAVDAATKSYRLAWCDGPPFAYHWGVQAAKKHLWKLGAPEPPDLQAFDESKYEPMPEVEINPPDELGQ